MVIGANTVVFVGKYGFILVQYYGKYMGILGKYNAIMGKCIGIWGKYIRILVKYIGILVKKTLYLGQIQWYFG